MFFRSRSANTLINTLCVDNLYYGFKAAQRQSQCDVNGGYQDIQDGSREIKQSQVEDASRAVAVKGSRRRQESSRRAWNSGAKGV